MKKPMLRVKTNKPISYIITDHRGKVLKKKGDVKRLLEKNRQEIKRRKK